MDLLERLVSPRRRSVRVMNERGQVTWSEIITVVWKVDGMYVFGEGIRTEDPNMPIFCLEVHFDLHPYVRCREIILR